MTNEDLAGVMTRLVERVEVALGGFRDRLDETNARLAACDRGVAVLMSRADDLEARLEQITSVSGTLSGALIETSATVQTLIKHLDSHVDTRVKQSMDERQSFNEIVLAREARERG